MLLCVHCAVQNQFYVKMFPVSFQYCTFLFQFQIVNMHVVLANWESVYVEVALVYSRHQVVSACSVKWDIEQEKRTVKGRYTPMQTKRSYRPFEMALQNITQHCTTLENLSKAVPGLCLLNDCKPLWTNDGVHAACIEACNVEH